jgi:uncharacterized protein
MAHPNEDLIRSGYDAFGKGDMAALRGLFADDIRWHFPGRNQLAGDYSGIDEVLGWLGRNLELSGGTLRVEPHDILANDEHAVALVRVTARREGRTLDQNSVQLFHVSGGKATEVWITPTDEYASDEFWS